MYSPVKIYNPISRNHTALLQPGQQLQITFHNVTIMEECKAHIQSDLVELNCETYSDSGKTFTFKQKYDLERWADVSTTFLGQIYFSGRGVQSPVISMYMSATNEIKRDIVTVVNPNNHTIKLYPHQILEVVMYTPVWGQELKWSCDFENQNALELLSDIQIDPTVYKITESIRRPNDAFYTYPRMLEHSGKAYLEHHWWYRWREMSANLAKTLNCPAVPVSFVGCVNGEIKIKQTIKVIINERIKPGWQETRSFQVTFEDSAMDDGQEDYFVQPFILPTLRKDQNCQVIKRRHHNKHENNRRKHSVAPQYKYQEEKYRHKSYIKQFQARDVMVRLKPMGSLEEGCRVVSDDLITTNSQTALPSPYKINQDRGYSFRSKPQNNPSKAAYYYDSADEQWD